MDIKVIPILCVLFLILPSICIAESDSESYQAWLYYTGNDYMKLRREYGQSVQDIEIFYVAGLSEAISLYGPKPMSECFKDKPLSQLTAIFNKWLDANPEKWDIYAAILYTQALTEACSK